MKLFQKKDQVKKYEPRKERIRRIQQQVKTMNMVLTAQAF